MSYLYMRLFDDPVTSELTNKEGIVNFGRIRVQEWFAPKRVSLHSPVEASEAAVSKENYSSELSASASTNEDAVLEFAVHPPWAMNAPPGKRVRPGASVLQRFVDLASASDEKIRTFAEHYGPLLVFWQQARLHNHDLVVTEQCDVWRYFARTVKALLRIGAGYHADRQGRVLEKDWNVIADVPSIVRQASELEDQDYLRDFVKRLLYNPEHEWSGRTQVAKYQKQRHKRTWVMLMNCLLQLGRTRPWLLSDQGPTKNALQVVFSGPSLLSYLALQICLLVAKQDAYAICYYCLAEYVPKRAPKTGQRNFCATCRAEGIPIRVAQRDRAERGRNRQH